MRTVNSGYTKDGVPLGYGKNGYGVGWTIPFIEFSEQAESLGRLNIEVHGSPLSCEVMVAPGVRRITKGLFIEGLE